MVRGRVVQRDRQHPPKKVEKLPLNSQGQTARPNAVRLSPEISHRGEPSSLSEAGAAPGSSHLDPSSLPGPTRGGDQGEWLRGVPRNLGDPTVSTHPGRQGSRKANSSK